MVAYISVPGKCVLYLSRCTHNLYGLITRCDWLSLFLSLCYNHTCRLAMFRHTYIIANSVGTLVAYCVTRVEQELISTPHPLFWTGHQTSSANFTSCSGSPQPGPACNNSNILTSCECTLTTFSFSLMIQHSCTLSIRQNTEVQYLSQISHSLRWSEWYVHLNSTMSANAPKVLKIKSANPKAIVRDSHLGHL